MKTLIVAAFLAAACVTPSLARQIPVNNGLSPGFDDRGVFADTTGDLRPAAADQQQLAIQPDVRMASAPTDQAGRPDGAPVPPPDRPRAPSRTDIPDLGDYRN